MWKISKTFLLLHFTWHIPEFFQTWCTWNVKGWNGLETFLKAFWNLLCCMSKLLSTQKDKFLLRCVQFCSIHRKVDRPFRWNVETTSEFQAVFHARWTMTNLGRCRPGKGRWNFQRNRRMFNHVFQWIMFESIRRKFCFSAFLRQYLRSMTSHAHWNSSVICMLFSSFFEWFDNQQRFLSTWLKNWPVRCSYFCDHDHRDKLSKKFISFLKY